MFADILNKLSKEIFVGHIGGDDFFLGFKNCSYEEVFEISLEIQLSFKNSAKSLYNKDDLHNEFILAKDRFGTLRKFELLSVSVAILELFGSTKNEFDTNLSILKKSSKSSQIPVGLSIL